MSASPAIYPLPTRKAPEPRALRAVPAFLPAPAAAAAPPAPVVPLHGSPDLGEPEGWDDAIPAPSPGFVRALAVQGYEVIAGTRSPMQLGPLVSVGLARQLIEMRTLRSDRRIIYRDRRERAPQAKGVRIDRPEPGIAEASAVLSVGERACAVALRLEWVHCHWRACELVVL